MRAGDGCVTVLFEKYFGIFCFSQKKLNEVGTGEDIKFESSQPHTLCISCIRDGLLFEIVVENLCY